jgi:hypothetical protein
MKGRIDIWKAGQEDGMEGTPMGLLTPWEELLEIVIVFCLGSQPPFPSF